MNGVFARVRHVLGALRERPSRLHRKIESQLGAGEELLGVFVVTPGTRPGLDWTLLGLLQHGVRRQHRRWFAVAVFGDRFQILEYDFRNRPKAPVASGDRSLVGHLRRAVEWQVTIAGETYWVAGSSVRVAKRLCGT